MGSGANVAIHASDVTLVRSGLAAVVEAIDVSRATVRTIREKLFWAFGYNVVAIPVAGRVVSADGMAALADCRRRGDGTGQRERGVE